MARAYRLTKAYAFTPARALALKRARVISAKNRHGRASSGIKVNYAPRSGPNKPRTGTLNYRFTPARRKALGRARKVNKNRKIEAAKAARIHRRNRIIKVAGIAAGTAALAGAAYIGVRQHQKIQRIRHIARVTGPPNPVLSSVPKGGAIKVNSRGTATVVKRLRTKYNYGRRMSNARRAAGMSF